MAVMNSQQQSWVAISTKKYLLAGINCLEQLLADMGSQVHSKVGYENQWH
jgi:hypothetical protein